MPAVDGGTAVSAHVWRDGPEAHGGKTGELMPPTDRQLRPPVHENNQRAIFRSCRQVEGLMVPGCGNVFCDVS